LRKRIRVTVYQPGWRLGGKCASDRNMSAEGRLEEHGLHLPRWTGSSSHPGAVYQTMSSGKHRSHRLDSTVIKGRERLAHEPQVVLRHVARSRGAG
jgi:hypothetical protein